MRSGQSQLRAQIALQLRRNGARIGRAELVALRQHRQHRLLRQRKAGQHGRDASRHNGSVRADNKQVGVRCAHELRQRRVLLCARRFERGRVQKAHAGKFPQRGQRQRRAHELRTVQRAALAQHRRVGPHGGAVSNHLHALCAVEDLGGNARLAAQRNAREIRARQRVDEGALARVESAQNGRAHVVAAQLPAPRTSCVSGRPYLRHSAAVSSRNPDIRSKRHPSP